MTRPIKVFHVLFSLEIGGAEKLVIDLSRFQREFENIQPHLVCVKKYGSLVDTADSVGLSHTLIGDDKVRYLSPIWRIVKIIRALKPDVIHTHNFYAHLHAAPAAKLLGVPILHTKHGPSVDSIRRFPQVRKKVYEFADKIAAVSQETREIFLKKSGVDPGKVTVVYNGIDTDKYIHCQSTDFLKPFSIEPGTKIFGAVSRLDPVKDHRTLLNAFHRVAQQTPNCVLFILGDGEEKTNILLQIEQLKLQNRVFLLGFSDTVDRFLAAIDLFLQPSVYEGLSLTILEAAAAGVPIITTPVGGTPEIITHGVEGILVEVGNTTMLAEAMNDFLTNPEKYQKIARNAQKKVIDHFSLKSMSANYSKFYHQII